MGDEWTYSPALRSSADLGYISATVQGPESAPVLQVTPNPPDEPEAAPAPAREALEADAREARECNTMEGRGWVKVRSAWRHR